MIIKWDETVLIDSYTYSSVKHTNWVSHRPEPCVPTVRVVVITNVGVP